MASKRAKSRVYKFAAIEFEQGLHKVYAFAMPGREIAQIAEITRIGKEGKKLVGFQRREIQAHVRQIAEYLNKGPNLFPNAIILAVGPAVKFQKVRGRETGVAKPGYLHIPFYADGERVAWIVDGQQRSIALSRSTTKDDLMVPVVAFVANSLDVQRQQFILVNRAKPLPGQLINELLPETDDVFLPKDLAANRIPSQLCALLHTNSRSPFHNRISRKSETAPKRELINDTSVITMIRERINHPNGALAQYKGFKPGTSNVKGMYQALDAYWSAVAEVFPQAWKLPPERSRLTHSAGIRAMGALMDRISARLNPDVKDLRGAYRRELAPLAKSCCWTSGVWPYIEREWNAIEQTSKGVNELTRALTSLYTDAIRA